MSRRAEIIAYVALAVVAAVLRLIDLGDRPFHHDESQVAYFSWQLFEQGKYTYQPILHGPLMYYLTALSYVLFGDSDFTARLPAAGAGTLMVLLPFLLRNLIGRGAAFGVAAMLAFGPTFLYYSRFIREDIFMTAVTLAMLVAVFRFLENPRAWGPPVIGTLLAMSSAIKEATYITMFVAGTFLIACVLFERWRRDAWIAPGSLLQRLTSVGWVPWAYGLAAWALTYTLLFTVFLTDPPGLWEGLYGGLDYWLDQQPVNRGGERWYFYLAIIVAHEWPVLLLGLVGIVAVLRRPTHLGVFTVWWFVVSMAVYGWASERFAWLAMHSLLPLIVLAGIGLQTMLTLRPAKLRLATVPLVLAFAAYLGWSSFLVNAEHRADPREWLVTTQSSEDVKGVVKSVFDVDARVFRRTGSHVTVTVDSASGASFPWAWYFRDLPAGYLDMTEAEYHPEAQVLLMTQANRDRLLPELVAYEGRRFRFRVWWLRDWDRKLDPDAWWAWWTKRETWNPVGGMPGWIYVRRDAAAS